MEEGDSWRLRLKESSREYYEKLNESEKKFYGELNEIRLQMGMSPVKVPFFAPEESTELKDYYTSQQVDVPKSTSATSADATPAVIDATWSHDVPKSASSPIDLEAAYVEESTNKLTINLSQEPHTDDLFLEENSENLKKNHQSSETSDSSLDGNPKDLKVDSDFLEVIGGHTQDSTPEIVVPVEDSTPEVVTSKIEPVQNESFLDEYNLLDEMSMEDESAKLQEMGDFESLKVTSLLLLEEIDGASSKVVSASLTEFVVEPHFGLLNNDGLPIIENINAHKVFVEKSRPSVHQLEPSEINLHEESQSVMDMVVDKHRLWNGNLIFDPGIAYLSSAIREETSIDVLLSKDRRNWVFDPGGS